jgi:hypothetical protein
MTLSAFPSPMRPRAIIEDETKFDRHLDEMSNDEYRDMVQHTAAICQSNYRKGFCPPKTHID